MAKLYDEAKILEQAARDIFYRFDRLTAPDNLLFALTHIRSHAEVLRENHKNILGKSPASEKRIHAVLAGAEARLKKLA
jgi:hypothetical protein